MNPLLFWSLQAATTTAGGIFGAWLYTVIKRYRRRYRGHHISGAAPQPALTPETETVIVGEPIPFMPAIGSHGYWLRTRSPKGRSFFIPPYAIQEPIEYDWRDTRDT